MAVFVATGASRSNNKWGAYAQPANPGYTYVARMSIHVEPTSTTDTTVNRYGWQRITGFTLTTNTAEKGSTRSPAFAGNVANAESVAGTVGGNPLYYLHAGQEMFAHQTMWAPSRPWAMPQLIDGELGVVVGSVNSGTSTPYVAPAMFYDGPPMIDNRPLRRRPTRRGMWWTYHHRNVRRSGASGASQIAPATESPNVWYTPPRNLNQPQPPNRQNTVLAPTGGTNYTDSGAIPVTISLSGADQVASTDSGAIPLTITLSGADRVASTDSGTIPVTIALSGTDQAASTDAGTIPITISLSGADQAASVDAGTIPLTITISGLEQFGPAPTTRPRLNVDLTPQDLPPV